MTNLSSIELRHLNDKILADISAMSDKVVSSRGFTRKMEALTIELVRKMTFKIKVMDFLAVKSLNEGKPIASQLGRIPGQVVNEALNKVDQNWKDMH